MRDDAARLLVGIMAGCDNIASTVIVTDKVTHEELGRSQISIKECGAWGVASQVIKKYTDGVVAYLSNKLVGHNNQKALRSMKFTANLDHA